MKKIIWLLNIDDYAPEITSLTYPLIYRYAGKIRADVQIIKRRRFHGWPLMYEKFQIFELAPKFGADWNIYVDSDAVLHPDLIDFTAHTPLDTVINFHSDVASIRWQLDGYFSRDGRNIGCGNWFSLVSSLCLDYWHPLQDLTMEEAIGRIFPTTAERAADVKASHLIDDYVTSRNVARFGLRFDTVRGIYRRLGPEKIGSDHVSLMYHQYLIPVSEKLERIKKLIQAWGL